MSNPRFALLLAMVLAAGYWVPKWLWEHPAPGVVAPETPLQTAPAVPAQEWVVAEGYNARALADYTIHARVLSKAKYRFDTGAKIAPVDLALGWGRMSDWSVYSRLGITQRGRYYLYEWGSEGPPIPKGEIINHSANNHIIPADPAVAEALNDVRAGDILWLEGQLVEVHGPGGFVWKSSLTREDTGGGACELFRVRRLVVETPPQG